MHFGRASNEKKNNLLIEWSYSILINALKHFIICFPTREPQNPRIGVDRLSKLV